VYSNDADVDPVGASVGMKGSRVQSVVQELRGEKIDIIPYSSDPAKFVCNALSPAKVSKVYLNDEEKYMEIVVADDQLSLAIGKRGQNVRLASKLTGWKIDIKSESKMEKLSEEVVERLTALPGIGEIIARVLYDEGFYTIEDVAEADAEELGRICGIGEKKAEKIVEAARTMIGLTTVPSEEGRPERLRRGDDSLEHLPRVGKKTAALLQESGYESVRALFQADAGVLSQLPGFSRTKAENLIKVAKDYIDKGK